MKLNNDIKIDLPKLIDSRLLVQANSGGGKSWANRRIIEQAFGQVQIIVLDPEGEFANLREKYDFVYAGKDGDCPAESRSAALLAHRLLELKASAIVDLYELPPQERKHFVKLFLEAMVNAPKDLWHDCLVILDEAHVFAPEKEQSESLSAVIDMASRGRKRGFCLIPATQRPAKLNKDVAAECNNKLIGRASLDIDRKRSAEELGFYSKEEVLSLRNLEPGEFYAFGPAISRDVIKLTIGDVKVKPPKRGVTRTVPPPTLTIKKILGKLADLPTEAKKELATLKEAKDEITALRRKVTELEKRPIQPTKVQKIEVPAIGKRSLEQLVKSEKTIRAMLKQARVLSELSIGAHDGIKVVVDKLAAEIAKKTGERNVLTNISEEKAVRLENIYPGQVIRVPQNKGNVLVGDRIIETLGKGEEKVLTAVAQHEAGISREHLTLLTGYKKSTRDRYLQYLQAKELVIFRDGKAFATSEGIAALGEFSPLPTGEDLRLYLIDTLPEGEKKILKVLFAAYPEGLPRDIISEESGYQKSTRDRYIQYLQARQLVDVSKFGVKAKDKLFES